MLELVRTMRDRMCDHPDAEQLMLDLATQLQTVKGKKSYGCLPKRLKNLVDEIVDEMEQLPSVSKCYDQWLLLQGKVDAYYHDKPQEHIPLSRQKAFTQIKNAVIHEAERLQLDEVSFEEKDLDHHDEPEEFRNESYNYWTLRDVIRNASQTLNERSYAVEEMETLAESCDMYAQYLMRKLWQDGPLLIPDGVNTRAGSSGRQNKGIWRRSTLLLNSVSPMIWKYGTSGKEWSSSTPPQSTAVAMPCTV